MINPMPTSSFRSTQPLSIATIKTLGESLKKRLATPEEINFEGDTMIETVEFQGDRYRGTFTGERVDIVIDEVFMGAEIKKYNYVGMGRISDNRGMRPAYFTFTTEEQDVKPQNPIISMARCLVGVTNKDCFKSVDPTPAQYDALLAHISEQAKAQKPVAISPLEELVK